MSCKEVNTAGKLKDTNTHSSSRIITFSGQKRWRARKWGSKSYALALPAFCANEKQIKKPGDPPEWSPKEPGDPSFFQLLLTIVKIVSAAGEKAEQGEMEQRPTCGGDRSSFSIAAFGFLRELFLVVIWRMPSREFLPGV